MRAPRVLAVDIGAGHVACGVFTVGASGRLVLQQFALEPHSSDPSHEGRWAVEIAQSLGAVAARRKLSGGAAIAVPGHLALTKFIKTPSVAKEKRGKIVMGCNAMAFGNCLSRLAIAPENCSESDGIAFGGHRRLQVARPDASSDETKFRLRHNQS